MPANEIEALRAARERVLDRIAAACDHAGRDPAEVTLVAVTKTVPSERIRAAVAAGLTTLGENRVQEGSAKRSEIEGATWHLIGPLQSNKARRALETFDVIETVDSVELAQRLDRLVGERTAGGRLPVLLQVNVDADPAKAGFDGAEIETVLDDLLGLDHLAIAGLMTVGRLVDNPEQARPTFAGLRALSERLRARDERLGPALSMGMSDDYPVAVEEGATIVRVGRALFGERHV